MKTFLLRLLIISLIFAMALFWIMLFAKPALANIPAN